MKNIYIYVIFFVYAIVVYADLGFVVSLFCAEKGAIGNKVRLIYAVIQCAILAVSMIICYSYI